MEIGTEISQKIRSAIKAKLVEVGSYVDDELPDYIMVMVANKKSQKQMEDDLSLFLGANTPTFTTWLHNLLSKLQSITADGQTGKEKVETSKKTDKKSKESMSEVTQAVGNKETPKLRTKSSSHSSRKRSQSSSTSKSASTSTSHPQPEVPSTEADVRTTQVPVVSGGQLEPATPTTQVPTVSTMSANRQSAERSGASRTDHNMVKTISVQTEDNSLAAIHSTEVICQTSEKPSTTDTEEPEFLVLDDTDEFTEEFNKELPKNGKKIVQTMTAKSVAQVSPAIVKTSPTTIVRASPQARTATTSTSPSIPPAPQEKRLVARAVTSLTKPRSITPTDIHDETQHVQKRTTVGSKRKPTSVVGTVIRKYTDEHEEEYDPHYPAIGNVASVVKVTARKSSVPKRLQANRALLLKAVTDAERSVTVKRQSSLPLSNHGNAEPQQKMARMRVPVHRAIADESRNKKVEKQVIVHPLRRTIQQTGISTEEIRARGAEKVRVTYQTEHHVPGGEPVTVSYRTDMPTFRTVGLSSKQGGGLSITKQQSLPEQALPIGHKKQQAPPLVHNKHQGLPKDHRIQKGSNMELVSKSRRQDMLRSFQYTVENKSAFLRMDQEFDDLPDTRQVECGIEKFVQGELSPATDPEQASSDPEQAYSDPEQDALHSDPEGVSETSSVKYREEEESEMFVKEEDGQLVVKEEEVESAPDNSHVKLEVYSDDIDKESMDDDKEQKQEVIIDSEIGNLLVKEEETFELESEEEVVEETVYEEYPSEPVPESPRQPPTNVVHGVHRKREESTLRNPPKTSPKFIVTLDGIDPSGFKPTRTSAHVQTPVVDRVSVTQRITPPKIRPFSISLKDSDDEHEEVSQVVPPKKARPSERCKFWPACSNGTECPFHHPTQPCKTFPGCKFGEKCLYIHPNCKFDSKCTRKDCPFTHASKRSPVQTVVHQVVQVPVPTPVAFHMGSAPRTCRFYPNCHNMSCPFVHPKPCRYGSTCRNQAKCTFFHPSLPSVDKLKWSANRTTHISERKFVVGSSKYLPSGLS